MFIVIVPLYCIYYGQKMIIALASNGFIILYTALILRSFIIIITSLPHPNLADRGGGGGGGAKIRMAKDFRNSAHGMSFA